MPKKTPQNKGASRAATKEETGSTLKFFVFGMVIGTILTLATQKAIEKNRLANNNEPPTAASPTLAPTPTVSPTESGPAIDFYTRLRDTEVLVPEAQQIEPRKEKIYFIQAASFRNKADADRARAQLILLNLDANITEFDSGTEVWHRIMVGPFKGHIRALENGCAGTTNSGIRMKQ